MALVNALTDVTILEGFSGCILREQDLARAPEGEFTTGLINKTFN